MSQTRAVEAKVQAMSPALNSEPMMGAGGSVVFMVQEMLRDAKDVWGVLIKEQWIKCREFVSEDGAHRKWWETEREEKLEEE